MKALLCSDIHGSIEALRHVLSFYDREGFEQLVLLGDILYYGPRNGLPTGHDAPAVAEALSARSAQILAVRGNCDSEVDQMMLSFPCLAPYSLLVTPAGHRLFLTHGHRYFAEELPLGMCDCFCSGHTHVPLLEPAVPADNLPARLNPGSPTFPKHGAPPTFATLEGTPTETHLTLRHLDGTPMKELTL